MKKGEKINSERYIQFLKSLYHNFSRHMKPLNWSISMLIQDNAQSHAARSTADFLQQKQLATIHQPHYSPDFNLLDRFVISYLESAQ